MKEVKMIPAKSVLIFLTFAFCVPLNGGQSETKIGDFHSYSDSSLFNVIPNTKENVNFLEQLEDHSLDRCFRIWPNPASNDRSFTLILHHQLENTILKQFQSRNITFEVVAQDIGTMVKNERKEIEERKKEFQTSCKLNSCGIDPFNYNDLETLEGYLGNLSNNPMNFTSLDNLRINVSDIGETYEKRKIKMVSLRLKDGLNKPAIFITCTVHAREWISLPFCLFAINKLIKTTETLLKHFDFYLVPVLNPDGYSFSWLENRFWRKNRRPYQSNKRIIRFPLVCSGEKSQWNNELKGMIRKLDRDANLSKFGIALTDTHKSKHEFFQDSARSECPGVDLNRNFDSYWGIKNSRSSCSDTYHGPGPFSEKETRALKDAIDEIKTNQRVDLFLDIHAFGQLLLTPYGVNLTYPPHNEELQRVANITVLALKSVHGTDYRFGAVPETIRYEASGGTIDWATEKVITNSINVNIEVRAKSIFFYFH